MNNLVVFLLLWIKLVGGLDCSNTVLPGIGEQLEPEGCDVLNFDVVFSGALNGTSKISNITTINGKLRISGNNVLTSIELNNLRNVTELLVVNNPLITSIQFNSLQYAAKDLIVRRNPLLTSIKFDSLQYVGKSLRVRENPILTSLDTFNNVTQIGFTLNLCCNSNLKNLNAFNNLTKIGRNLDIVNNAFENLNAFHKLEYIGNYFSIFNHSNLVSVQGFDKLISVGYFRVFNNPILNLFNAFNSLQTIDIDLRSLYTAQTTEMDAQVVLVTKLPIYDNPVLNSITFFQSLINVTGNIDIINNGALKSLQGLEKIIYFGGNLTIQDNILLNCSNTCDQNIIYNLKMISNSVVIVDQCDVLNFECENQQNFERNNCNYEEECIICNPENCNFEPVFRKCGDDILDIDNEECDNITDTNCANNCTLLPILNTVTSLDKTTLDTTISNILDTSSLESTSSEVIKSSLESTNSATKSSSLDFPNSIKQESTQDFSNTDVNRDTIQDLINYCRIYKCEVSTDNTDTFEIEDLKIFSDIGFGYQSLTVYNGNLSFTNQSILTFDFGNDLLKQPINITNGCLDGNKGTLEIEIDDSVKEDTELILANYKCLTSKFDNVRVTNSYGEAQCFRQAYLSSQYSVILGADGVCNSNSPKKYQISFMIVPLLSLFYKVF